MAWGFGCGLGKRREGIDYWKGVEERVDVKSAVLCLHNDALTEQ